MRAFALVLSIGLALFCSCGGSSPRGTWKPEADEPRAGSFPSLAELSSIAAAPPADKPQSVPAAVARWELEGPFPDELGATAREPGAPWERGLAEAAAAGGATVTEQMSCAAREIGRFRLTEERMPSRGLTRFVASRCGAVATSISTPMLTGAGDGDIAAEELYSQWQDQARQMFRESASRGAELGVWFGVADGKAVLIVATAVPSIKVASWSRQVDDQGRLEVAGELLEPAAQLRGYVSQGDFGAANCALDPLVALPRFRVLCPAQADDDTGWLELVAFPENRALGRTVFDFLIWPAGTAPTVYEAREYAQAQAITEDAFAGEFVELVNAVRTAAELPPLAIEAAQSETATQLVWHYFAASERDDGATADQIALGLLAGWRVSGDVYTGWFRSALVGNGDDLADLVAAMLESPSGRMALLHPEARRIAVGPARDADTGLLGVMLCTYGVLEDFDARAAERAVRKQLGETRRLAGLPEPGRLVQAQSFVDAAAGDVQRGATSPSSALDRAMRKTVRSLGDVRGGLAIGSRVDDLAFPDTIVQAPELVVAISVALHRADDHPWVRYAALMVAGTPTERLDQLKLPGSDAPQ